MASTDIIDLFLPWTQSSQEAERKQRKFLEKGLDRIAERKSTIFSKFRKSKARFNPVIRWMEERSYEHEITATLASTTLTFSGNLLGAAITDDALKQHVKKNTILRRISDGVQMRVTADPSYAGLTATVAAHGNNSLSNDSAATTYTILGDSSSDYDATYQPRGLDRSFRWCSTQIWKDYLEMPHSKRDLAVEIVSDELQHQLKRMLENLHNKIALSSLLMEPVYSASAYKNALETENPTMTGLLTWPKIVQAELANPNVYVDMNSVPVDVDQLNSLVYYLWADEKCDFNSGNWIIGCHGITHQYLCDEFADYREFGMKETEIGYVVNTFRSKLGKVFPVHVDNYVPADTLFISRVDDCEWGYYGKQAIRVVDLPEEEANIARKKITFQTYGVVKRSPRQIGMLYDLPTTYSS